MRILIADDDPIVRRMLETQLVKWGHEVVTACDGHEAWEVLQRDDAPPLVILDWMMPGIDGATICRKVRETFPARPTYVLLLTALEQKEDIIEGLEAGANDYMVKSFNPEDLHARIQTGVKYIIEHSFDFYSDETGQETRQQPC
ncbi:MAG: response regulator [Candidatus Latescibacteria bacterium]|nr:response regulator [Candidatus Latescibacterota bacterium]